MVGSQYLFSGEVSAVSAVSVSLVFPETSAHCRSFLSTEEQLVMKMFIN